MTPTTTARSHSDPETARLERMREQAPLAFEGAARQTVRKAVQRIAGTATSLSDVVHPLILESGLARSS